MYVINVTVIYPLNIEEWLNVDIKEYNDVLKYRIMV